jgi:hypothetical protein
MDRGWRGQGRRVDETGPGAKHGRPLPAAWVRRVAAGAALLLAGALACYGSAGAIWAGRNEAVLGNSLNAAAWGLLAAMPWLSAVVSMVWLGFGLKRWSSAIKWATAMGATCGVAGILGAFFYGVSGL